MKHIIGLIIALLFSINVYSQDYVQMKRELSGIYTVPCEVNGLKLRFVFDTGASDVSLSLVEAAFMLKNGYIEEGDFIGAKSYQLADGSISDNMIVNLKQIKIGPKTLYNVKACISSQITASMLLGQSAIQQLGRYSIDGDKLILGSTLIENNNYGANSIENISLEDIPVEFHYNTSENSHYDLSYFKNDCDTCAVDTTIAMDDFPYVYDDKYMTPLYKDETLGNEVSSFLGANFFSNITEVSTTLYKQYHKTLKNTFYNIFGLYNFSAYGLKFDCAYLYFNSTVSGNFIFTSARLAKDFANRDLLKARQFIESIDKTFTPLFGNRSVHFDKCKNKFCFYGKATKYSDDALYYPICVGIIKDSFAPYAYHVVIDFLPGYRYHYFERDAE